MFVIIIHLRDAWLVSNIVGLLQIFNFVILLVLSVMSDRLFFR